MSERDDALEDLRERCAQAAAGLVPDVLVGGVLAYVRSVPLRSLKGPAKKPDTFTEADLDALKEHITSVRALAGWSTSDVVDGHYSAALSILARIREGREK